MKIIKCLKFEETPHEVERNLGLKVTSSKNYLRPLSTQKNKSLTIVLKMSMIMLAINNVKKYKKYFNWMYWRSLS